METLSKQIRDILYFGEEYAEKFYPADHKHGCNVSIDDIYTHDETISIRLEFSSFGISRIFDIEQIINNPDFIEELWDLEQERIAMFKKIEAERVERKRLEKEQSDYEQYLLLKEMFENKEKS